MAESAVPVGDAFPINATISGIQADSRATVLADGRIVITWQSFGQDGAGYGVYAQVLSSTGFPEGSEFLVNTTTAGSQGTPNVIALASGGFVIDWVLSGQPGLAEGIAAQIFDVDANPLGTEFRIDTTGGITSNQGMIALADGGFVATWSAGGDGDGLGQFGQRFDAIGNKAGGVFQINTTIQGGQKYGSSASLVDGGFVSIWTSEGQDGSGEGVFAQRFDSNANKIGGEFLINSQTAGDQRRASIASLSGGGFVVIWESTDPNGSGEAVVGQIFSATGSKVGGEIEISPYA